LNRGKYDISRSREYRSDEIVITYGNSEDGDVFEIRAASVEEAMAVMRTFMEDEKEGVCDGACDGGADWGC
jgi:hypothetical protein